MAQLFKLNGEDFPYNFELDENGFVWLLDYEMKGSKSNMGQTEGGVKDIEQARNLAHQMVKSMGIL